MALVATGAHAAALTFTSVRSNIPTSHSGVTVDASTGKFYARGIGNATVYEFANQAAFEAGTITRSFTLAASGNYAGTYGTYFAVRNGKLFQHASISGNDVGRWNIATGAFEAGVSVPGFDGANAQGFDWGGGSSMNIFETMGDMYVMSGASTGAATNYAIAKLGDNLAVSGQQTASLLSNGVSANAQGFGFSIGGRLFLGADYYSQVITQSVNLANATVAAENIQLLGMGSNYYLTNLKYIAATDTLYAMNQNTGQLYKSTGVAAALGVSDAAQVPEPAMIGLFGLGLVGVAARRRRKAA